MFKGDYRVFIGERKHMIHQEIRRKEKEAHIRKLREQRLQQSDLQSLVDGLPSSAERLHKLIDQGNQQIIPILQSSQQKLLDILSEMNFSQWLHMCFILTNIPCQDLISRSHARILYQALQYLSLMPMYRNQILHSLLTYFTFACQTLTCIGVPEIANLCRLISDKMVRYDEQWERLEEMEGCVRILNVILGQESTLRGSCQGDVRRVLEVKRRKFQCIARALYDDRRVFLTLIRLIPMGDAVLRLLINVSYEIQRQQYKNLFTKQLDFASPLIQHLHKFDLSVESKSLTIRLINNLLQLMVGTSSIKALQLIEGLLQFSQIQPLQIKCETAQVLANFIIEQNNSQSIAAFIRNKGLVLFQSVLFEYSLVNPMILTTILQSFDKILRQQSLFFDQEFLNRIISTIADIYDNCQNQQVTSQTLHILELLRQLKII